MAILRGIQSHAQVKPMDYGVCKSQVAIMAIGCDGSRSPEARAPSRPDGWGGETKTAWSRLFPCSTAPISVNNLLGISHHVKNAKYWGDTPPSPWWLRLSLWVCDRSTLKFLNVGGVSRLHQSASCILEVSQGRFFLILWNALLPLVRNAVVMTSLDLSCMHYIYFLKICRWS